MTTTTAAPAHAITREEHDSQGYGDGLDDLWRCTCGESFELNDGVDLFQHGQATAPRPLVWVAVEGGIASAGVAVGSADVVQWDWDNIAETTDPGEIEDAIAEAERLPESDPDRAGILANMRERLDALRSELTRA